MGQATQGFENYLTPEKDVPRRHGSSPASELACKLPDPILVIDENHRITYANMAAASMLQCTPEAIRARPINTLLTEESASIVEDALRKATMGNANQVLAHGQQLDFLSENGAIMTVHVKSAVLQDSGKRFLGLVISARDLESLALISEERKKLEEHLMHTQRLESIGTLAGGVAHDFNNILTTILGYTELIMKGLDESTRMYSDIKQIRQAAHRGENLVKQLMIFSRRHQIEFKPINVNAVIDDMQKMLQRIIGEDITVSTRTEPGLWTVKSDAGRLEQVIMNLAVNARDAMPDGGEFSVQTSNAVVTRKQCRTMHDGRPGKYVVITVSDTGIGIDPKIIDRIYEPFFTTKGIGEGAGLGLASVYGIVRQHDGWVTVHSRIKKGTTFKVFLPADAEVSCVSEAKEQLSDEYRGNGEGILFVEDDRGIRDVVVKILQSHGYRVTAVESAEAALEVFNSRTEDFRAVLSDVVLPGKNGLQLAGELSMQNPGIRIILSSGYTDDKSHWDEIRQKKYRFVQKPYTFQDLLKNIWMALQYG